MRTRLYKCGKCERTIKICATTDNLFPSADKLPEHDCKKVEKAAKGIKTRKKAR